MVRHTTVNSQNTYKIFIQCLDVCAQVCIFFSVGRNPLKINLHVYFYFNVSLTLLYNTCETDHIESSVLLSLSASCLFIAFHKDDWSGSKGERLHRGGFSVGPKFDKKGKTYTQSSQ